MLERAIAVAANAHAGMKDKGGSPYILHPLRVMLSLDTELERICGVLHDVVEDTTVTLGDLRAQGIPEEVLIALDLLTKRTSEKEPDSYAEFIDRICVSTNQLACRVKLADLKDNLDFSRIKTPSAEDSARVERYRLAAQRLGETWQALFSPTP